MNDGQMVSASANPHQARKVLHWKHGQWYLSALHSISLIINHDKQSIQAYVLDVSTFSGIVHCHRSQLLSGLLVSSISKQIRAQSPACVLGSLTCRALLVWTVSWLIDGLAWHIAKTLIGSSQEGWASALAARTRRDLSIRFEGRI